MRMKAKGVLFIIMSDKLLKKVSSHTLTDEILQHVETEKEVLTKYCSRIYPIDYALHASVSNFDTYLERLVLKYMPLLPEGKTKTWCLKFKCRNNNKLSRQLFMDTVLKYVPAGYHFIQYKAEIEIFVDITQHTMCMTILSPHSEDKYYSF